MRRRCRLRTRAVLRASATWDFAVTLSGMSGLPVMVDWATASGTAKAGEDYENADGTLTIAAGDTAGTVSIAIVSDNVHEAEETFSVNLSGAMYSMLADASATGTITDDDAAPTLAIADAGGHESDGAIHFTISLTGATALPASVSWGNVSGDSHCRIGLPVRERIDNVRTGRVAGCRGRGDDHGGRAVRGRGDVLGESERCLQFDRIHRDGDRYDQ